MVGYREDALFLLEAYNPHRFSKQLGFSLAIPGFKSRSQDTFLALEGLSFWRSCIANSVFSTESITSAPLEPGKGKSAPRLPSSIVSSSSKPLKKHSLPEDDLVDRDLKHAKWGTTRRPEAMTEIVYSDESSDCIVTEVADLGDEARELMDSMGPLDCVITAAAVTGSLGNRARTEVVDVEEPSDCVIMKAATAAVPAASLFTSVHHIEPILRDILRVACLQDLSSQGEGLKAIFSAARDVRDAQCSVVPSEVHDRFTAIEIASGESSSKLQHETEAIGSVRTTLHQFEKKDARLRQELVDLDTHVEDVRARWLFESL
ncbi:hypothetical protein LIER_24306 [Lithospermum erythrorhizon]|uniref:Uncharacterized protein n=1 Tax=Lithospermum erythrorhizon TaxID=34254 RepID=A0AAV3R1T1_LITER